MFLVDVIPDEPTPPDAQTGASAGVRPSPPVRVPFRLEVSDIREREVREDDNILAERKTP